MPDGDRQRRREERRGQHPHGDRLGGVIFLLFALAVVFGMSFGLLIKLFIAVALIRAIVNAALGIGPDKAQPAVPQPLAEAPTREELERIVLRVASGHGGYVTPEALVMESGVLSLKAARELLEDLAASGDCEMDTDDEGHLHYRFRTSVGPARDTRSPDEWVAGEARRLSGDDDAELTRVDG